MGNMQNLNNADINKRLDKMVSLQSITVSALISINNTLFRIAESQSTNTSGTPNLDDLAANLEQILRALNNIDK